MRFDDLVRVSLRQVVRHRRRYIGVVLAIAMGVAGFISIITMGQDVKKNFNEDLAFIGGVTIIRNVLEFRPQHPLIEFHYDTVQAIQKIPGVAMASLVGFEQIKGFWKGQPEMFSVVAVDEVVASEEATVEASVVASEEAMVEASVVLEATVVGLEVGRDAEEDLGQAVC